MVRNPLPTSLHAGVDTSVIALWLGHEPVTDTQIPARQHGAKAAAIEKPFAARRPGEDPVQDPDPPAS